MNSTNLPDPLPCPEFWKYNDEWENQYKDKYGFDYLSNLCKHGDAGFRIMRYIQNSGEKALTQIKRQNLFIKRFKAETANPLEVRTSEIEESFWTYCQNEWEELFEIYNANLAPKDVAKILVEVKAFMDAGQLHCQLLLQYLDEARIQLGKQQEVERAAELGVKLEQIRLQRETEREQIKLRLTQENRASKAERIKQQADHGQAELPFIQNSKLDVLDVVHSKVADGFIYLLSNELMPSVFKIGFTAGSPDKRAREVTEQYRLPSSFRVVEYWRTKDPYIVEQRVHEALANFKKAGEFFEVDLKFAKEIIEV
jgi:T5orf172 domain